MELEAIAREELTFWDNVAVWQLFFFFFLIWHLIQAPFEHETLLTWFSNIPKAPEKGNIWVPCIIAREE